MLLKDILVKLEKEELGAMEDYFVSIYPDGYLVSHGLDHHRRVWKHAKELITSTSSVIPGDPAFCFKLMTACYLHDIGMAKESGKEHGIHSRKYCSAYLSGRGFDPAAYAGLLDAIEYHDDKDYSRSVPGNLIYEILSLSDDLDAFGYTGIFRYTEIYTERGTSPDVLGQQIAENAAKRYRNFLNSWLPDRETKEEQEARYKILLNFCSGLKTELYMNKTDKAGISGHRGIAEIIIAHKDRLNSRDFLRILSDEFLHDRIIHDFLTGLGKEL